MNLTTGLRLLVEALEDRRLMASGAGVTAQYFSDTELTALVATRTESSLDQNWGTGVPVVGLAADQFSARFTGQLETKTTELHTFALTSEVGARLWVNGTKLLDRWTDNSIFNATASIDLVAGRRYDIQLEIRETIGLASVQLRWSTPTVAVQSISTGQLLPSERGALERRVWNGLAGNSVTALTALSIYPDSPSDSTLITTAETTSTGQDQYGQLFIGLLYPPKTGAYRFYLAGDDAAELWLSNSAAALGKQRIAWLTNATGVRDWTATTEQQSVLVNLVAGQGYAIDVLHKESSGSDHVAVGWKQPGASQIQVIDGQYFSPPLPAVKLYSKQAEAAEGATAPIEFVVQRSGGTLANPLTVAYSVSGATPGVDYAPLSGSVTILAGEATASVFVTPLSDGVLEGNEILQIELLDRAGYDVGLISERKSQGTIQNVGNVPTGGTLISPPMLLGNYDHFGGTFTQIPSTAPYSRVIQAAITTLPADRYDAQLRFLYAGSVQAGDLLWADFYVRSVAGIGKITAIAELNGTPYTKSLDRGMSVPMEWTRVQLPFVSAANYAAGGATFGFYLGAQLQTLQFADIAVRKFGAARTITPSQLFLNNIGGTWGAVSPQPVNDQAFATAMQIDTVTTPPNDEFWRLQYGGRNSAIVRSGDTVRFEFMARALSGAAPRIGAAIQTTSAFNTLTFQTFNLTSAWQVFTFNTTFTADFAIDGLQAMLNVGYAPQTVQVAAIKWTNELPSLVPPATYVGRDSQDTWRTAADERIAAERQSTLTVHVVDTSGNPVPGALVSLRQTQHDFIFGSAIDGLDNLLQPTGNVNGLKYQSEIKRLFNGVTIENSLKWPSYLQDRQRGIDAANWVVANGLLLRGHNVVWPSQTNMPGSVWSAYDTVLQNQGSAAAANYLRQTIQARVQDAIATFANHATEWDIVNEPFDNHKVMDILGDQVVVDWFLQARQIDPDVVRVLNDYDIFSLNGNNVNHRANYAYWLNLLKANQAIEVMGEQSHYSESTLTDIAVLGQLIQSYYAQFALPIEITEFDVTSSSQQLQADYLRDYMQMAFSQSAVTQFIQWGFWSQAHWKPDSAMYNSDFSIRPNGQVYEDLVFGKWWTDTRGTTRNGDFATDVFEGDYVITVMLGNQTVTRTLQDFSADDSVTLVVNSLPTIVDQTFVFTENNAASPGTVVASDNDAGQALSYAIVSGNLGNTFAINSNTGAISVANASLLDFETHPTFTFMIRVTDNGTPNQSSEAQVTIALVDLPELLGNVVIGDGSVQRSLVKQVSFTLDGAVTIDPGAFLLTKRGAPSITTTQATQATNGSGQTVVTISFSGVNTHGSGALDDGYYQLVIDGSKLRRGTQQLDVNADGIGGDTTTIGAAESDNFFALFGDTNGDGLVGIAEFGSFRSAFGKSQTDLGYNLLFDYEQDGAVGISDFGQFRSRFGKNKLVF